MSKKKIVFFVICLALTNLPVFPIEQVTATQILDKMLRSIQDTKTMRYKLNNKERIKSSIFTSTSFVKLNEANPKKIYLKNPVKGLEILWVEGENKNEAYVYPNAFPYITLSLDPYKSLMRKNQHHTIFDLGFTFIGKTIANNLLKSANNLEKHFRLVGSVLSNGTDCYHIYYEYPNYKIVEYVAQKDETVRSIAAKLNIAEYRIRELNSDLMENFDFIKEGRKLVIPNNYSNKTIMYVDKKTFLPLYVLVYDDQGFFESYEYSNLETNINFKPNEFSRGFPGYKL